MGYVHPGLPSAALHERSLGQITGRLPSESGLDLPHIAPKQLQRNLAVKAVLVMGMEA